MLRVFPDRYSHTPVARIENGMPNATQKRQAYFEEQGQKEEDDQQALQAVVQEQLEPVANLHRPVAPCRQRVPVRQLFLLDVLQDVVDHRQQVFVLVAKHAESQRRLAVDERHCRAVDELVANGSQILQRYDRSVVAGDDGKRFEFVPPVAAVVRSHVYLARSCADRSSRLFAVFGTNRLGDASEREAVRAEGLFRNFDVDLIVLAADYVDLRDGRQGEQFLADPLRDVPEGDFVLAGVHFGAGHSDVNDRLLHRRALNDRIFRQLRKTRDSIDLAPDFVERPVDVLHVASQFDRHRPGSLVRHRSDLLDPLDAANRLFDLLADALFHLLRSRARKGNAYGHDLKVEIGERLATQMHAAIPSGRQDRQHEDVHGGRIRDGPAENVLH